EKVLKLRVESETPSQYTYASAPPTPPPTTARQRASIITDATTGRPPKPMARSVAISTWRLATAEYMQLSAPKVAPTAMNPATVYPSTLMSPESTEACLA